MKRKNSLPRSRRHARPSNDADEDRHNKRFDDQTRKELKQKFTKAFAKANSNYRPADVEFEADVFVGTLEGFAWGIPQFEAIQPPEQKRRREKVRALAVALENLHHALTNIDSAALDFAVWRGLREVDPQLPEIAPSLSFSVLVASLREDLPTLKAFSAGVRMAHKDLPPNNFNFTLKTVLAVERMFLKARLPFTVSNSGFAAQCLRAIFLLGGLEDVRMDYWLTLARNSDESMGALIKRFADRQKTADE